MPYDFKKNAVVETLEEVPAEYRGLYEEGTGDNDGKFAISAAARQIVADYVGTTEGLGKARADKKAASDESAARRLALKEFEGIAEEFGIEFSEDTPLHAAMKSSIADLVAASKNGKDLKINLDKMKADFEKRLTEAVGAKDAELADKDKALAKHLIGDVATRAISEAKGNPALLTSLVRDQCKMVKDGEEYVVRVVDAQGDFRSDGAGGFLGVKGLVAEIKNDKQYAQAFESEAPTGGGTPAIQSKPQINRPGEKSPVNKISDGLAKLQSGRVAGAGA
jgi:hypothetical protein